MKKTNLEEIQKLAMDLLLYVEPKIIMGDVIVSHPLFESLYFPDENGVIKNVQTDENAKNNMIKQYTNLILNTKSYEKFSLLITKPYRLNFYKLTKIYANKEDCAKYFREAWINTEGGNLGNVIQLRTLCKWFKELPKEKLMTNEEFVKYNDFPEELIIYRGTSFKKQKVKALSWTLSKDVADFFANRWSKYNNDFVKIYSAKIKKADILAYFKNEEEVIVDYQKLYDIKELNEL